MFNKSNGY